MMLIDNDSQKRLIDIISITINDKIEDCPIDKEVRKIKEKEDSLRHTKENTKNILISSRYSKTSKEEVRKSTKVDNNYKVVPFEFDSIMGGNYKPINVNDTMFGNIKASSKEKEIVNKENDVVVEKEINDKNINDKNINDKNVDDIANDNIVTLMKEITESKKIISEQKEKLRKAEIEVEKTDKIIAQLNEQYLDVESQLKQVEEIDKALENKIIAKLKEQKELLNYDLSNVEKLYSKVDERQKQNKDKIVEFNSKINNISQKISQVNNRINNNEEFLKSFDEEDVDKEKDFLKVA